MSVTSPIEEEFSFSKKQQLFIRFTFAVLIDLTVLNLFGQYWDLVYIDTFTISLLAALLLQTLLKATLVIEHKAANYFKAKKGLKANILRGFSTWAILFISKIVILAVINFSFSDQLLFKGPIDGLLAFIVVIFAIIAAEQTFIKINNALA